MILIGLCGFMGSGKGAAGDILRVLGFSTHSFAHPLKDATAAIFGWDRKLLEGDTIQSRSFRETPDPFWSKVLERDFTPREALQKMGTEAIRNIFHEDIWLRSLEKRITGNVVITDVRFQNEIDFIHSKNGIVLSIERGNRPDWFNSALCYNSGKYFPYVSEFVDKVKDIHPSEYSWVSDKIDYNIKNDGTIEQLKHSIIECLTNHYGHDKMTEIIGNGDLYETK